MILHFESLLKLLGKNVLTICVQLADKQTRIGEQTAVFPDNQTSDKDDKYFCKTESKWHFQENFQLKLT